MYNSNEDALKETARAATDGNVCSGMDENAFETILKTSVDEFPPNDIVKEVTPWRNAISRILTGLALCAITLNIWRLQFILPACGIVLTFLGFRALRYENRWFRNCFVIAAVRMIYYLQFLILNTTILPDIYSSSPVAPVLTFVNFSLLLVEIFCFWRGIRDVQKKIGLSPKAGSALALIIWYAVLYVCSLFSYVHPIWILAMIIGFFFIIRNIYALSKELVEAGYGVHPVTSKITNPCIVVSLLAILVTGGILGYLFGGSYPMDWKKVDPSEQSEVEAVKAQLLDLGFPAYVLNDLAPEDIAACAGALQVVSTAMEYPANDGRPVTIESVEDGKTYVTQTIVYDTKELLITGVGVQVQDAPERWVIFHHFLWMIHPGFYGTESIQLLPAYRLISEAWRGESEVSGRLLYDRDGETFVSSYYSLGNQAYVSNHFLWGQQPRTELFANFSLPEDGENHRGYLTYTAGKIRDGVIFDSWFKYIHQKGRLQYPVRTAMNAYMNNPFLPVEPFAKIETALQFFPTEDGVQMLVGSGNEP